MEYRILCTGCPFADFSCCEVVHACCHGMLHFAVHPAIREASCNAQCCSMLFAVREKGLQRVFSSKAGPPEAITGQGWTSGVAC